MDDKFNLTPEEEHEMQRMHEQMMRDFKAEEESIFKHNSRIFKSIEKTLGKNYLEAVKDCLKESEAHGKLELVRSPEIEKQEEDWDEFDHILVDQYVNGGYLGDDFAGDIYIPLRGDLYLKSFYQM